MKPAIVFRPAVARGYAVAAGVIAAVVAVAFVSSGGVAELIAYGALPLFLAVAGWVAFWRPLLRVEPAGVRVVNALSTTWLPWQAITGTRTRWGLELVTHGPVIGVWALTTRSVIGRWTTGRREAPALPALETLDAVVPGGGDPLVAAGLVEEHKTGHLLPGGGSAPRAERRLDAVPAGLLLLTAALAVMTLIR